jgi:hypothetical protein
LSILAVSYCHEQAANITATLAKAEAAKMDDLRPSESVDTSENQVITDTLGYL